MRSRFERLLASRRRSVFLVCVLIALSGVAVILWARIDAGDRRADQMQTEADRRGRAVSTLARDVRDGYSLQVPASDPDALVCRSSGTVAPAPSPGPAALLPVLPVLRRRMRRTRGGRRRGSPEGRAGRASGRPRRRRSSRTPARHR